MVGNTWRLRAVAASSACNSSVLTGNSTRLWNENPPSTRSSNSLNLDVPAEPAPPCADLLPEELAAEVVRACTLLATRAAHMHGRLADADERAQQAQHAAAQARDSAANATARSEESEATMLSLAKDAAALKQSTEGRLQRLQRDIDAALSTSDTVARDAQNRVDAIMVRVLPGCFLSKLTKRLKD